MKQKKARVEDALHATRAAVEEGILPGGGVALLRCTEAVEKARDKAKGDETNRRRYRARRSVGSAHDRSPRTAASTAPSSPTKCARSRATTGYDANTGEYVDMFKAGIIDPVKVVRTALPNAASIAGLMLTTEALVTTYDKDDKAKRSVEGAGSLVASALPGRTLLQRKRLAAND